MSAATSYIIKIKFFLLISHLIIVGVILYQPTQNIYGGIPANMPVNEESFYASAKSEINVVASFMVILIAVQMFLQLVGTTLFFDFLNMILIFIHFIGMFLSAWFVLDDWSYQSLKYLFIPFTIVPTILEVVPFIGLIVKKFKSQ